MVWDSGAEEEVASKDCKGELKFLFGINEPNENCCIANRTKIWVTNGIWADYCMSAVWTVEYNLFVSPNPRVTRQQVHNLDVGM